MTKRALDQYLAELDSLLTLDEAARAEILAEIEDHFLDAFASGMDERAAIERFGDPAAIAADYNAEGLGRGATWATVAAGAAAAARATAQAVAATRLAAKGGSTPGSADAERVEQRRSVFAKRTS